MKSACRKRPGALGGADGELVLLAHPAPLLSFAAVRAKIYGRALSGDAAAAVIGDIASGRYADIELAAFITVCSGRAWTWPRR